MAKLYEKFDIDLTGCLGNSYLYMLRRVKNMCKKFINFLQKEDILVQS